MDLYFVHRDEYERLYNCSFYSVDDVPLEQRTHTRLGYLLIALFVIFEALYIPCMFSMWRHLQQTCYRLMFAIGIVDMLCLFINGLLSGYLALTGAVFCTHPTLIYFGGALAIILWYSETTIDVCLAINRCLEMNSHTTHYYASRLFDGWRLCLWLAPCLAYGLLSAWYTKLVLFSSVYMAWFFNPHVGYYDDTQLVYHNYPHSFHNNFVIFVLFSLYGVFFASLIAKKATLREASSHTDWTQTMTFLQVGLISLVNASAACIYVYIQYVSASQFVIYVAHFSWVLVHGLPSVIYLLLNRTIRNDSIRALKSGVEMLRSSGIHASTVHPLGTGAKMQPGSSPRPPQPMSTHSPM